MAPSAELSIASHSLGMTALARVLAIGPAFGAIGEWIDARRPDEPGDRTWDQPI